MEFARTKERMISDWSRRVLWIRDFVTFWTFVWFGYLGESDCPISHDLQLTTCIRVEFFYMLISHILIFTHVICFRLLWNWRGKRLPLDPRGAQTNPYHPWYFGQRPQPVDHEESVSEEHFYLFLLVRIGDSWHRWVNWPQLQNS